MLSQFYGKKRERKLMVAKKKKNGEAYCVAFVAIECTLGNRNSFWKLWNGEKIARLHSKVDTRYDGKSEPQFQCKYSIFFLDISNPTGACSSLFDTPSDQRCANKPNRNKCENEHFHRLPRTDLQKRVHPEFSWRAAVPIFAFKSYWVI